MNSPSGGPSVPEIAELVEALKELAKKGLLPKDDPATLDMLCSWIDSENAKLDAVGRRPDMELLFLCQQAEMYAEAGMNELAQDAINGAAGFAGNYGTNEDGAKLRTRLEECEAKIGLKGSALVEDQYHY